MHKYTSWCIFMHIALISIYEACPKKEGASGDIAFRWTYSEAWNGFLQMRQTPLP